MSLRLFAAAPVPPEVTARLVPLQRGVLGASWRPAENFHITLRFFGDVDEGLARELDFELGQIRVAPFEVTLGGANWFGGERPTALWAAVNTPPEFKALAQQCERAARRVGLGPDRRRLTPHITLAYCHGTGPDDAARFVRRVGILGPPPFWIDRFHLYSSWLGKGPSRYVPEADYPLVV